MKIKLSAFVAALLFVTLACQTLNPDDPTEAPTAVIEPTSTSAPAASSDTAPIPGWKKFEGGGVEIWLPESYNGGDLDNDLEVITESLRNLGPDYASVVQMIEDNPGLFKLWAFDSNVGSSGVLTNVNIISTPVLSAVTIDVYLDAAETSFPEGFEIVDRENITLANYEAGRLTTHFSISGSEGMQYLYLIIHENIAHAITFTTGVSEFEVRSLEFEQSIDTFRITE